MRALALVARARDALEAGELVLVGLILDELEQTLVARDKPTVRCPCCATEFRWPGELARHQDVVGHEAGDCP